MKEPSYYETVRDGQRKRIYENLPRSNQFNFRYQFLLRNQEEQSVAKTFKTDMVVFGEMVSKIYTDVDTRVIQGCPVQAESAGSEEEGEEEEEEEEEGRNNTILKFCWKHRYCR